MKNLSIFLIVVILIAGMVGCGGGGDYHLPTSQNLEIRTWYDLDDVRDNLAGNHTLMNDINLTSGYTEVASPTANEGQGWHPIGTPANPFSGTFDGQGYEIRDLFINRPDESQVGLFSAVDISGCIKNLGLVNVNVTGCGHFGALVGVNEGTVSNSYSTGNVNGGPEIGGLVGQNRYGTVRNCYSAVNVIGTDDVGGLVGHNDGSVSDSYSSGNVTGENYVGGLVGANWGGYVSNSHSASSVNGEEGVGGLVGDNGGAVSNSYSTGNVIGNGWIGGLIGWNYGTVNNSYSTGSVNGVYDVSGLVGYNDGTVSDSFWNVETSGQATSAGGIGKTTIQMQDVTTFSGATWDIIAVANPSTRNPSYIWNIVDDETYPCLSWEPVS